MLRPQSEEFEKRLAKQLGVEPSVLRSYLFDVVEERLWRGRKLTERITGFTFKRGSHSGMYIRDPEGTDVLAPNVEPPPERPVTRHAQ